MSFLRRDRPERRLLDEGQRTRSMLWIMAIMLFLTVLATDTELAAVDGDVH